MTGGVFVVGLSRFYEFLWFSWKNQDNLHQNRTIFTKFFPKLGGVSTIFEILVGFLKTDKYWLDFCSGGLLFYWLAMATTDATLRSGSTLSIC